MTPTPGVPSAGMTDGCDTAVPRPATDHRRGFGRYMEWDRRLPAELVDGLWQCPDELLSNGRVLKRGGRSTTVELVAGGGTNPDVRYVLKRFHSKDPIHSMTHCLMRTRARRGWKYGRLLRSNGVRTPWPLAYEEKRIGPVRHTSFLLTEYIPGLTLTEYMEKETANDGNAWSQPASTFAGFWSQLGTLRMTHGDLKASNFIVGEDLRLWVIDLDSASQHPRFSTFWTVPVTGLDTFSKQFPESTGPVSSVRRRRSPHRDVQAEHLRRVPCIPRRFGDEVRSEFGFQRRFAETAMRSSRRS